MLRLIDVLIDSQVSVIEAGTDELQDLKINEKLAVELDLKNKGSAELK